jgi:hypothetical protein
MVEYLHIFQEDVDLQNVFAVALLLTGLLMMFNMYISKSKYLLNITQPNVYVFEYERQSKTAISSYQIINLLIRIIGYTLFFTSILYFYAKTNQIDLSVYAVINIFLIALFIVFNKYITVALFFFLIKKVADLHKIRHIRTAFDVYFNFYLIFLSFFIFFFPFHKSLGFISIMAITILFYMYYLLNYSNSLIKHINFKTYQLILYLCISEILPIMLVIYWLSFHII